MVKTAEVYKTFTNLYIFFLLLFFKCFMFFCQYFVTCVLQLYIAQFCQKIKFFDYTIFYCIYFKKKAKNKYGILYILIKKKVIKV